MASPIILTFKGETAKFQHKKLDRSKLYGTRRRIPLDAEGRPCERAEITDDGELLIRAGMTAQKEEVERREPVDVEANINADAPLRWTGKLISKAEAVTRLGLKGRERYL